LSSVTQSADHSVNVSRAVMLSQLDRFDGLVVFTTNFPRNYDAAFVRRILAHVKFDMPDLDTRRRLWEVMLPPELPVSPDVDPVVLAAASEGLAGGDLVNIVISAATAAVGRPGDERFVTQEDLLAEIASVRLARAEVGKQPRGTPTVTWEKLTREESEEVLERTV
jgi:ATP-dependent 26S proteasome regulatory subunit